MNIEIPNIFGGNSKLDELLDKVDNIRPLWKYDNKPYTPEVWLFIRETERGVDTEMYTAFLSEGDAKTYFSKIVDEFLIRYNRENKVAYTRDAFKDSNDKTIQECIETGMFYINGSKDEFTLYRITKIPVINYGGAN